MKKIEFHHYFYLITYLRRLKKKRFTGLIFNLIIGLSILLLLLGLSPGIAQESLSGFSLRERRLILKADDFGMHPDVNKGIIKAYENGMITSVALMMPYPAVKSAVEYIRKNPQMDVGIHLTLTSEWKTYRWGPVLPKNVVPSLTSKSGYFYPDIKRLYRYAKLKDVEKELRAQVEKALDLGIKITHLDGHMGFYYFNPQFLNIVLKLAKEYNLPIRLIKIPQIINALKRQKIRTVDNVSYLIAVVPPAKKKVELIQYLDNLPGGVTEIIFHPQVTSKELRKMMRDSLLSAEGREEELNILLDKEVKKPF